MAFDHAAYIAMRAAEEARKSLSARLRLGANELGPLSAAAALMTEAADAIDHLHGVIARQRREANEAEREFQREARDIAAEARRQEREEQDARGGWGGY
jgi:hypothetical protein